MLNVFRRRASVGISPHICNQVRDGVAYYRQAHKLSRVNFILTDGDLVKYHAKEVFDEISSDFKKLGIRVESVELFTEESTIRHQY